MTVKLVTPPPPHPEPPPMYRSFRKCRPCGSIYTFEEFDVKWQWMGHGNSVSFYGPSCPYCGAKGIQLVDIPREVQDRIVHNTSVRWQAAQASYEYEHDRANRYMKIAGAYKTLFEEEQALRSSYAETL